MKATAKKSILTDRAEELVLVADTAADEFLLTEILRIMTPDQKGKIIITHAKGHPRGVLEWGGSDG